MKLLLTFLVCFFASSFAIAANNFPEPITLSWTLADQYVDGTTIQPGDLASTRVTCSRHDGVEAFNEIVDLDASDLPGDSVSNIFPDSIPKPGTYTCFAFSVTIDGTESDASNAAIKKYTGKPNPPNNLSKQ